MMDNTRVLTSILAMALVTYISRAAAMVLFCKKIRSRFLRSFLNYTPFGVLAALIVPDILFSTAGPISGIAGSLVALLLAYCNRGLLAVSLGATLTVFLTERILALFF